MSPTSSSCKRPSSRMRSGQFLLLLSPPSSVSFCLSLSHLALDSYYDPIVKRLMDSVLDVTAIVLANLCVSYIMTSQNEEAEELMRKIEKEEERLTFTDPDKQCFHLCIVNLVIGTLYCSKGNYEFGISRIIKVPLLPLPPFWSFSSLPFSLWIHMTRSCTWTPGTTPSAASSPWLRISPSIC
jgi:hypothetical protein